MRSLHLKTFVVLGLAAPALAQQGGPGGAPGGPPGGPPGGRRGMNPEQRWEQLVERFDADKDGRLSKAEFAKRGDGPAVRMDKNDDGVITREEAEAGPQGDRAATWFERLDADKDGKVTEAELAKPRDEAFARMDKDGDGHVTRPEWEQARAQVRERREGGRGQDGAKPAPDAPGTNPGAESK